MDRRHFLNLLAIAGGATIARRGLRSLPSSMHARVAATNRLSV